MTNDSASSYPYMLSDKDNVPTTFSVQSVQIQTKPVTEHYY